MTNPLQTSSFLQISSSHSSPTHKREMFKNPLKNLFSFTLSSSSHSSHILPILTREKCRNPLKTPFHLYTIITINCQICYLFLKYNNYMPKYLNIWRNGNLDFHNWRGCYGWNRFFSTSIVILCIFPNSTLFWSYYSQLSYYLMDLSRSLLITKIIHNYKAQI